jgi:hypothetical protein
VSREAIDHPSHYTSFPGACLECGRTIEAIDVIEWLPANLANVVKYVWRHGLKNNGGAPAALAAIEDLEKAVWYLRREISRIERIANTKHVDADASQRG